MVGLTLLSLLSWLNHGIFNITIIIIMVKSMFNIIIIVMVKSW